MAQPVICLNMMLAQHLVRQDCLQDHKEIEKNVESSLNIREENPTKFIQVTKVLGEGGTGKVYLVKNLHTDLNLTEEEYAIKKMISLDHKSIRMLKNEASLISFLDSNELIKCYAMFKHKKEFITLLEYMSGGSMKDIIRDYSKSYSEDFCRYTLYKVALGICKMHSKQVLHRDIKSENILCSHTGEIKIADLGLSTFLTNE